MEKIFLFPGQGSQFTGMGKELFKQFPELVNQVNMRLGYSIEELCLLNPDNLLKETEYTQPAIYTVSILSYLSRIDKLGLYNKPEYVAGHSLGEYAALYVAGAFDFLTGLDIVKMRGSLMSKAPKGAMVAVIGIDFDKIVSTLDELPFRTIDIANINTQKQHVLSGIYEELLSQEVEDLFHMKGANFIPLKVSSAFHSRFMLPVEQKFEEFLATIDLKSLQIPVISNLSARPYPKENYTENIVKQISNPVRWYESISWLVQQGCSEFEEVEPGNVLSTLNTHILRSRLAFNSNAFIS